MNDDTSGDVLVVAARAKGELWVLVFREATAADAMRQIGLWAASEDLAFSWYDAACLAKRVRAVAGFSEHGIGGE